jgi:peptidoglycan-associated lipoprotein
MRSQKILALALGVVLLASCGPKRPPASSHGRNGAPPAQGTNRASGTSLESGDLQPIPDEATPFGEDLTGTASPEGGPLADIYFAYNQSGLTDEARAILDRHAQWLQGRADVKVRLEGHCDERGTVEYNIALGDQRAKVALEYLASLGVPMDRLSSVSYGKERPVEAGHDESAWAKNRRVHFAVSR